MYMHAHTTINDTTELSQYFSWASDRKTAVASAFIPIKIIRYRIVFIDLDYLL